MYSGAQTLQQRPFGTSPACADPAAASRWLYHSHAQFNRIHWVSHRMTINDNVGSFTYWVLGWLCNSIIGTGMINRHIYWFCLLRRKSRCQPGLWPHLTLGALQLNRVFVEFDFLYVLSSQQPPTIPHHVTLSKTQQVISLRPTNDHLQHFKSLTSVHLRSLHLLGKHALIGSALPG